MWNQQLETNNKLSPEEIVRNKLIEIDWEKAKNHIIKNISQDVYAVSSDKINTTSFFDGKWELILSIRTLRLAEKSVSSFVKTWTLNAWFWEVKEWEKLNLYKRSDIDLQTLKPLPWAKSIDQWNEEYFQAWKDIDFCIDRVFVDKSTDPILPWYYYKFIDLEWFKEVWMQLFYDLLNEWAIKIDELEFFIKEKGKMKNRQITQKMFEESIQTMQQILPKQCADTRFKKIEERDWKIYEIDDSITIKDLEWYLERGRIDEKLFSHCKKNIDERDKILEKKEQEKWVIRKKTAEILEEQKKKQEELRQLILKVIEKNKE